MSKRILYYGVEQTGGYHEGEIPQYTKGVFCVNLGPWDDERQLRPIIEARCRANPDCNFLTHLVPGGIRTSFFQWLN